MFCVGILLYALGSICLWFVVGGGGGLGFFFVCGCSIRCYILGICVFYKICLDWHRVSRYLCCYSWDGVHLLFLRGALSSDM